MKEDKNGLAYSDFGDPVGNVPFEIDFRTALSRSKHSLSTLQQNVLTALVDTPGNELSGGQIARQLGLTHHAGINGAIVGLARALTRAVAVEPPRRKNRSERWWHVVAEGRYSTDRKHFYWKLRPALRDAAIEHGFSSSGLADPQENSELLFEGALRRVTVNSYERNPVARRLCIDRHGLACAVCGLVLTTLYGPLAEGIIHIHHLKPLSECGGKYQIDPVTELCPVCPNCHVMLHRRQPPLEIAELKAIMERLRVQQASPTK